MSRIDVKSLLVAAFAVAVSVSAIAQTNQGAIVSERVKKLTRAVPWKLVESVPIKFHVPSAGHGEDRRQHLPVVGRHPHAHEALPSANGLRAYFIPEDEKSTMYIYDAEIK
jgi:hypothetical protein